MDSLEVSPLEKITVLPCSSLAYTRVKLAKGKLYPLGFSYLTLELSCEMSPVRDVGATQVPAPAPGREEGAGGGCVWGGECPWPHVGRRGVEQSSTMGGSAPRSHGLRCAPLPCVGLQHPRVAASTRCGGGPLPPSPQPPSAGVPRRPSPTETGWPGSCGDAPGVGLRYLGMDGWRDAGCHSLGSGLRRRFVSASVPIGLSRAGRHDAARLHAITLPWLCNTHYKGNLCFLPPSQIVTERYTPSR